MHKLSFSKALQTCKSGEEIPFHIESADKKVCLDGSLSHSKTHPELLKLQGILKGAIALICDRSGEEYEKSLNESLRFYLSDGIVHLDCEHFEEIYECLSGVIDFNEILDNELEMIRCDYHIKE